jgi:ADP-heptose:LPS heptosyltransferase/Tfp pilus assembly protein PilF
MKNKFIQKQYNQAIKNINQQKYELAIENYKMIIKENPKDIDKYYIELGKLYEERQMYYPAITECYIKIIQNDKNNYVVLNNIGTCYFNLSQYTLAIHYFKKVLIIKQLVDVYCNMISSYMQLKDYITAEIIIEKAYELDKNYNRLNTLLGVLYYCLKKYDKSIEHYMKVQYNDEYQQKLSNYNASFSYLAKRNFNLGFEFYEYRLYSNNLNHLNPQTNFKERADVPYLHYWNGKDTCNHLLIIYEQGIGDNIQYYRFMLELRKLYPDMKISYFCRKDISHLFKPMTNIVIIGEIKENEIIESDWEYKIYAMSLPKMLNIVDIQPNEENYIHVNEEKMIYWKNVLFNNNGNNTKKRKIGFVYNGFLSSFIEKNIPLQEFEILLDLNIELICLHKKEHIQKDIDNITFKDKIQFLDIDKELAFEDTICILKNIDLLITIDSAIVHLAGVLNVKTWLLLGKYSEWRWGDEDTTYWYNSVELIRMREELELKHILKKVKDKLLLDE